MFTETVSFPAAFIAGLLSFLSPCVLPLIPAYFTFITGFSLEELTRDCNSEIRKKVFLSTFLFVLGFSLVFILMGASASFLGSLMYEYKKLIRIIGGVFIILLGIHLTGLIRIPGLDFEKRINHGKEAHTFFRNAYHRNGLWRRMESLYRAIARINPYYCRQPGDRMAGNFPPCHLFSRIGPTFYCPVNFYQFPVDFY